MVDPDAATKLKAELASKGVGEATAWLRHAETLCWTAVSVSAAGFYFALQRLIEAIGKIPAEAADYGMQQRYPMVVFLLVMLIIFSITTTMLFELRRRAHWCLTAITANATVLAEASGRESNEFLLSEFGYYFAEGCNGGTKVRHIQPQTALIWFSAPTLVIVVGSLLGLGRTTARLLATPIANLISGR